MDTQNLMERPPTEQEAAQASTAMELLSKSLEPTGGLPIEVRQNGKLLEVDLPAAIGELILNVLGHVARGEMVTIVPYGAELSTQKAADLLNVSRPHLTKLLDRGELAFHKVGAHRRVLASDLLAYKARRDQKRSDALDRLQMLGQEHDAH